MFDDCAMYVIAIVVCVLLLPLLLGSILNQPPSLPPRLRRTRKRREKKKAVIAQFEMLNVGVGGIFCAEEVVCISVCTFLRMRRDEMSGYLTSRVRNSTLL